MTEPVIGTAVMDTEHILAYLFLIFVCVGIIVIGIRYERRQMRKYREEIEKLLKEETKGEHP